LSPYKEEGEVMTARAVKLKVVASVPKDCSFWAEDDGWNGFSEDMSITVRGTSFADAKSKMEEALREQIETLILKYMAKNGKRIA
jgi:hypothetical protein